MNGTVARFESSGTVIAQGDLHQHPRFLLFVPATLVFAEYELACTVHNISAGGAKIRTNTTLDQGSLVTLQIDIFDLPGEVVWSQGEFAGIGFHQEPDTLQHLITTELADLPSRMDRRAHRRCSILMSGTVFVDGGQFGCMVKNVSLGGARIACDQPIEHDRAVILEIKRFGMFPGRIVWRYQRDYGVSFASPPSQVARMVGDILPRCVSCAEQARDKPAAPAD